nr:trigger factor [Mycoplasmopsis bovis]
MSAKSIELNKEKGSVVVEYEFSGEKWTNIFNKTKTNKIKKLKVDGFRPGKAPKHIVDKYVTPVAVASDSINEAYNVFADEIFEEVKKTTWKCVTKCSFIRIASFSWRIFSY